MKAKMHNVMYRNPVMCFCLVFSLYGVACQPLSAAQKVIALDSFSLDGKERVAGLSLDGVAIESGKVYWKVPAVFDNTVLIEKGAVSSRDASAERAVQAVIPINDPSDPITVQADVVTETSGWVSVGILANDSATWFDERNLLFALIEPKGRWVLFRNLENKQVELASGDIDGYSSTQPTALALTYDPASASAQVFVNSVNVSGDIKTGIETTVEISAAGFYIFTLDSTVPGMATVDNFKVLLEKP